MIIIKKTETWKTNVQVALPSDNPDKPTQGTFVAEFRHFSKPALRDLMARAQSGEVDDSQLLDEVLVGVSGIGPEVGEEYPAADQLAMVRDHVALSVAAIKAFTNGVSGAVGKISSGPPAR